MIELQKKLEQLMPRRGLQDRKQLVEELLQTVLPRFEKDLQELQKGVMPAPPPPPPAQPQGLTPAQAIQAGQQKYTDIRVPVLAIYAVPHDMGPALKNDTSAREAAEAKDLARFEAQAKAFESSVPSARVVRLAHANHYVFRSNEADVPREMNAFLGSLP